MTVRQALREAELTLTQARVSSPEVDARIVVAHVIASRLSLINMKPRGIVLTHGHIDHTSAAGRLCEIYKEKGLDLAIAIHAKDKKFMGARAARSHEAIFGEEEGSGHESFDDAMHNMPKADIYVEDEDKLFDADLKVIHTPGHTAGSICIYSESQALLFSGDTLLFEGIGRTDLPGGDKKALVKSIREKLFTLPPGTRVFPGHGPFTAIEREVKHNPFLS